MNYRILLKAVNNETPITPNMNQFPMDYSMNEDMGSTAYRFVLLVWNCRGLNMHNRLNALVDQFCVHNPEIVILTETRMPEERAREVSLRLNPDSYEVVEPRGLSGGILLLWREAATKVTPMGSTQQEIHALIEIPNSNHRWLLTTVYASPRYNKRSCFRKT